MAEHRGRSMKVGEYLEIKSWALSKVRTVMAETKSGKSKTTQCSSIFKVPPQLLGVRENAFTPEIFAFGPFYTASALCNELKMCHPPCLFGSTDMVGLGDTDHSFGRWRSHDQSRSHLPLHFSEDRVGDIRACMSGEVVKYPYRDRWDQVLEDMIDLVEKARECYEEPGRSRLGNSDFFKIMVVDGCYIIELLRSHNKFMTNDKEKQLGLGGGSTGSPIFKTRWVLPSLQRDLIKLQNQLPLVFLEKLFSMTTSENGEPSLQDLFVAFFRSVFSLDESIYMLDPNNPTEYAHPLDLFHSFFVFSMRKKQEGNRKDHGTCVNNPKLIYSAQDLQEAGVKIIRKDNSSLLDISFDSHGGVLHIPPLSVDENMTVTLLNFVAYEQCDRSKRPYFINYLLFLDSLINTAKDVEILHKNRIIWYPLGNENEVVDLFNSFWKGMLYSSDQTYLSVHINAVNSYCEAFYNNKWRFWWSNLKREEFNSPWTFLSLVVAIVLLIVTNAPNI